MEHRDREVCLDQQVLLEPEAPWVSEDLPVLRVPLENLEPREDVECPDLMDLLALRDRLVTVERLGRLDPRVRMDTLADLDRLDFKAYVDLLDVEDLVVPLAKLVKLVNLVRMVRTESLDPKVCRVCLDQWELLETRVPWENREPKVILV